MNPDSEQILNRFVAGELSLPEENDFLAFCEIDPQRYRRATLAIVEHRRMADALRAIALPNDGQRHQQDNTRVQTDRGVADPTKKSDRLGNLRTRNCRSAGRRLDRIEFLRGLGIARRDNARNAGC